MPDQQRPAGRRTRVLRWLGGRRGAFVGPAVLVAGALAVYLALHDADVPQSSQPPSAGPSPSTGPSRTPTASAWVSSPSGESRMSPVPVEVRRSGKAEASRIVVDTDKEYQRIDGFGAGMTHSSAEVIAAMPPDRRDALIHELFDPDGPVRLSYLRVPIGASDFVSGEAFTHDDRKPGETDPRLTHFSIDRDRRALLPVLREALAANPGLKIIASPWSPPAWLKTSGSLQGGRLLDTAEAYDTYARYLVRFVRAYADAGVPIAALTVQNEPQLRHPDGYPGTDMPVRQEAELIERLGPALRHAGLSTEILGFDHNWALHPADEASTPPGEDPERDYPADLIRTPAARWLAGTAFHCYYGDAAAQTRLHSEFPGKGIWVTECSGSHGVGDTPAKTFSDTFRWQADHLLIASLSNWSRAVLTWNVALDPTGGPHVGGCDTCTGVVTVGPRGAVTRNAEYYVLAHASRFVAPGADRVGSQAPGGSPLHQVAFRNPDGSIVLVAFNTGDRATTVRAQLRDHVASASVPARSLVTIKIHD